MHEKTGLKERNLQHPDTGLRPVSKPSPVTVTAQVTTLRVTQHQGAWTALAARCSRLRYLASSLQPPASASSSSSNAGRRLRVVATGHAGANTALAAAPPQSLS